MATLLERIGGEGAVRAAVDAFYVKVMADPLLIPFFAQTDMDKQRLRQAKFLIAVMAGTAKNVATYMRNAHRSYVKEMGLSDVHFDAVNGHLHSTLADLKVPGDIIGEVMAAMESMRAAVLDRPAVAAAE